MNIGREPLQPPAEPVLPQDPADVSECIARIVEQAPKVMSRVQFFVWSGGALGTLLPHDALACGAYHRYRRSLAYELFHRVVLDPELVEAFKDSGSTLMRLLVRTWIASGGRPLALARDELDFGDDPVGRDLLRRNGLDSLIVHGVTRPRQPDDIETMFVFASTRSVVPLEVLHHLDLLMPTLHSCWQRVWSNGLQGTTVVAGASSAEADRPGVVMTEREIEILAAVRRGGRNKDIGEELGISPLTVKNHLQKILRKLGANNRAQAVAEAISLGLLNRPDRT